MGKPVIEIITQGTPRISSAFLLYSSDHVAIVELDMSTKYCDVSMSSAESIWLTCSERTPLDPGDEGKRWDMTQIKLVDRPELRFLASGGGRYTIELVFASEPVHNHELPLAYQYF